ncbi:viral A-type inclusion protein [Spirosoma pollinicola]|uniref:Viral A-type inclusion protein n=1 Tax=Spirosoma pollinicola TaxID=2057025 RepID=A0A2K8YVE9_9BACT|nr:viral A-type inclusion protein [Spirosoma pollinicola]AUD01586.1 viral A-type inclusion protein [Spirosoma pollinicola]
MRKCIFSIAGLFLISGTFWACNSGEETVKETENEVFAIHDEVMPKIDDIMKLRKGLKQRITSLDSLKASGSAAVTLRTDEEKEQANRLHRNLDVADSLMMDWMSRYNGDTLAKLSSDEALRYLNGQKDQITDVKTKVNSSIEQARQFLGKK